MITQKPVYECSILHFQNVEATKMSFSSWVHKQTVVHPHSGTAFRDNHELPSGEKTQMNIIRMLLNESQQKRSQVVRFQLDIGQPGKGKP